VEKGSGAKRRCQKSHLAYLNNNHGGEYREKNGLLRDLKGQEAKNSLTNVSLRASSTVEEGGKLIAGDRKRDTTSLSRYVRWSFFEGGMPSIMKGKKKKRKRD